MAQFGIVCLDRVGIGLPHRDLVAAEVVPQLVIEIEGIAEIVPGFGCLIHQFLQGLPGAFPDDLEAQITAGGPVYEREDVDPLFFSR